MPSSKDFLKSSPNVVGLTASTLDIRAEDRENNT
jgi:hypothetical protein